jgi:DNA-binding IclR family transcriptional regulator
VLSLGFEYIASLEIVEYARPILEDLASATGHQCHLVVRDEREVVVVFKSSGETSLLGSIKIGARFPAHATLHGRMCLAFLDEAEVTKLYKGVSLKRYSPYTPTTMTALRAMLAEDRQRGFSISREFFHPGICAVVAPVFEENDRIAGAINVLVPRIVDDAYLDRILKPVLASARELSLKLNYRGNVLG